MDNIVVHPADGDARIRIQRVDLTPLQPSTFLISTHDRAYDRIEPSYLLGLRHFIVLQLGKFYSYRDQPSVIGFLVRHPPALRLLLEARTHLQKHFGLDPRVVLELVPDPYSDRADKLFAHICTSLPPQEALARLDRLDDEWFLDRLSQVSPHFNFNLEFE